MSNLLKNNKLKHTLLLIFLILMIAAGLLITQRVFLAEGGSYVVISVDGQEMERLSLDEDQQFTAAFSDGGYNIIVIKDHKVSVTEANCDNQLCVNQGEISENYELIVCLPHGLAISIETE